MLDPTMGLEDVEARVFERFGLDVRTRFLEIGTPPLRIQVDEVGSGPSVVVVGGGGTGGAVWAPLMAGIGGMRLLAVSRPGAGRSDAFDYRGVDLRRHAVGFLEDVMDELGIDRAPIVAHSMGGLWSLWLALDRPDRVSALAQLGCPALLRGTTAPLSMRLLSLPRLGRLVPSPVGRSVTDNLTEVTFAKRLPTEMIVYLRRAERQWARSTTRVSLIQSSLRFRGPRRSLQLRDRELAKVGQPVLFIWGDRDAYGLPTVGHHAVSIMPKATIEVLPGGHLPWLEHPDRCAKLVGKFLARSLIPGRD